MSYVGYTYDANNRLILRSHDADGYYGTIGDTTRTLYVQEMGQVVLELEKTGSWADFGAEDLTHRYLWGPAVDQLLADDEIDWSDMDADGESLWALADHLGSVRQAIDNNATAGMHREIDSAAGGLETFHYDAAAIRFLARTPRR